MTLITGPFRTEKVAHTTIKLLDPPKLYNAPMLGRSELTI